MVIQVYEDRTISIDNDVFGTQNENNATTISFIFPTKYENFTKKIVFLANDSKFAEDIVNNEFKITTSATRYSGMSAYIWLTNGNTEQDFRTKLFNIGFFANAEATSEIPAEEPILM